jgi:hypothetical protein
MTLTSLLCASAFPFPKGIGDLEASLKKSQQGIPDALSTKDAIGSQEECPMVSPNYEKEDCYAFSSLHVHIGADALGPDP